MRILFFAAALIVSSVCHAEAQTSKYPEQLTWWSEDMKIGPGLLEGTGKRITIRTEELRRKLKDGTPLPHVDFKPGTTLKDADLYVDRATLLINGSLLKETDLNNTLNGWVIATDSAFDNVTFGKAGGWFVSKYSSKWRLTNCLVYGAAFVNLKSVDYGFQLERCSFYHVDFPEANYRGDPAKESQEKLRTVKDCRFVRCNVPVSLLIATENCVFENCTFYGPYKGFAPKAKLAVSATLIGSSKGYPEKIGSVTFTQAEGTPDLEKVGTTVRHLHKSGKLRIYGFPDPEAPIATPIGTIVRPLPDQPAKPEELPRSGITMIRGSETADPIEFKTDQAEVQGLLVRNLGWRGLAGGGCGIHAVVLSDRKNQPAGVGYSQDVGSMMQHALGEVIKYMEVRQKGWPVGKRVEISFDDKYTPSDGPSGAVATALILEALFTNRTYDPTFAVTGDLNADGSVQAIGGVDAKLRGAFKSKSTLVAIPKSNETEAIDVAILDGINLFTKMQVFTIDTFNEALEIAAMDRGPELTTAMGQFRAAVKSINPKSRPTDMKKDKDLVEALEKIQKAAPNHLSARIILDYANGDLPKHLSPRGSMNQVTYAAYALLDVAGEGVEELESLDADDVTLNLKSLARLKGKLHPKLLPLEKSLADFGAVFEKGLGKESKGDEAEGFWMRANEAGDEVSVAWRKIVTDPIFIEDSLRK